jgi:hypothetical protein
MRTRCDLDSNVTVHISGYEKHDFATIIISHGGHIDWIKQPLKQYSTMSISCEFSSNDMTSMCPPWHSPRRKTFWSMLSTEWGMRNPYRGVLEKCDFPGCSNGDFLFKCQYFETRAAIETWFAKTPNRFRNVNGFQWTLSQAPAFNSPHSRCHIKC